MEIEIVSWLSLTSIPLVNELSPLIIYISENINSNKIENPIVMIEWLKRKAILRHKEDIIIKLRISFWCLKKLKTKTNRKEEKRE